MAFSAKKNASSNDVLTRIELLNMVTTEFMKIATATAVGLGVMGFIGFFVRLIHIPINAILLGTFSCLITTLSLVKDPEAIN